MHQKITSTAPVLALQIRNWSLPGAKRFLQVIPDSSMLEDIANFIANILFDDKYPPPVVRSITFAITSHGAMATMQAAAFHSVADLDATHHMIEISEPYLAKIDANRLHDEVLGICVHEMVHCFQPSGDGEYPHGLREGLADWVRLQRGLGSPHWKPDITSRWDVGYDTTAYFLDYLENIHGPGIVVRINNIACSIHYMKSDWEEILGKGVESLWQDYCAAARAQMEPAGR